LPYAVGLTGGIGSGKTTVANLFAQLGAGVVDTDSIAHQLTGPGQPALMEIARQFGFQFVTPEGALDRRRMRELVFNDPTAKKRLEAILHPRIRTEGERELAACTAPYVIVVVPLLFETGAWQDLISRKLVVDCEPEIQISRVMSRSGLTREEVMAIMATQTSRSQRLRLADDVIDNNEGTTALNTRVAALHKQYLAAARQH
jgi:dephospho-CoA kinase